MCFWKEKKISMFSASQHKMFLRLWACVEKDLLKDCNKLGWNIPPHKFGQGFFVQMNWKRLFSTEWLWNVWSFSLLQRQQNWFAAHEHRSIQTSLTVHPSLMAFGHSLCATITSAYQTHHCYAAGASLLQLCLPWQMKIHFYAGWTWLFAAVQMWLH